MCEFKLDTEGQERLENYFGGIGQILGHPARRSSFAIYAQGILGEGERKSMEPIAARACPNPEEVEALHQRLQHFVVDSTWDDHEVRRFAATYAIEALTVREQITHWILDDTGFLKQGNHSVGVQRQYTGSAGKIANCQIGVSLTVATPTSHLPIDFALYLPRSWAEDPARRKEARIPDEVEFRTKPELGLAMIKRALASGIPPGLVLVDTSYGNSTRFRRSLRRLGLPYAVAVNSTTKVWPLDKQGRRRGGRSLTVSEYAAQIVARGGFRRTTWRAGTKGKLSARFARRRVLPIADEGVKRAEREAVWLLMEWEEGESKPNKFYFVTLPEDITKKQMVRHVKQRWRTERVYEDLKGELGLDHFEGRRYPGWHHHVSVVLACNAFVVAEQARRFSPSAAGTREPAANPDAARASLRGLLHHRAPRHRAADRHLASAVPVLSS
jgi:SRSO17 transposase